MTQSQENDQKHILWPILAHICPKYFFNHYDHRHLLDIMPVYHHMQI